MKPMLGLKFGRLTTLRLVEKTKHYSQRWLCQCDCGNTTIVQWGNLGRSIFSCGCLKREKTIERNTKHGLSGGYHSETRLYKIWINMRGRCQNKNNGDFRYYGGRGILVCKGWDSYKNFYEWAMNHNYNDNLTLDRINNNKGYSPENCRWTTRKEQARNSRSNRIITFNEKNMSVAEWAEYLNINPYVLYARLHRNWSIERTLTQSIRRQ